MDTEKIIKPLGTLTQAIVSVGNVINARFRSSQEEETEDSNFGTESKDSEESQTLKTNSEGVDGVRVEDVRIKSEKNNEEVQENDQEEIALESQVKIGVSSCLIGEKVRHNAGHANWKWLSDVVGTHKLFKLVPDCPEVGIGMSTPREPIRIVDMEDLGDRLIGRESATDFTEKMTEWSKVKVEQLKKNGLDGYILKSKSPSCGLERIKVYKSIEDRQGTHRKTSGLFAQELIEKWPQLPMEDEGRLNNPVIRETFITASIAHHQFRTDISKAPKSIVKLLDFHANHKYMLMARSAFLLKKCGKLLGEWKLPIGKGGCGGDIEVLFEIYYDLFFRGIKKYPTRGSTTSMLQHIAGYFKNSLSKEDKEELHSHIIDYQSGDVPLILPLSFLKHYSRKLDMKYVQNQAGLKAKNQAAIDVAKILPLPQKGGDKKKKKKKPL